MGSLSVDRVSKCYKTYPGKWARVAEWLTGKARHSPTWILRDVAFSVGHGETVGLVGVNGAGKSTLLKIIAGTTQPTSGVVTRHGRVAALLELGMGFHADFTGRQNVWMAGQILGHSRDEITKYLSAVEAFAEIGDYIDRPVRMYSSGMQMRLAFSVATAIRPDLLIVDEALSVGDAYFQHKSFERIRQFRQEGTSLLIVSHDRAAIQSLCDRAILIDHGWVQKDGEPEEVMDYYNAIIAEKGASTVSQSRTAAGRTVTRSGTGEATVEQIELLNAAGRPTEIVEVGEQVTLRIRVVVNRPIDTLVLGYSIKDRLGQVMYGTNTWHTNQIVQQPGVNQSIEYRIQFDANLGVGSYSIQTALVDRDTHLTQNYDWRDLAYVFSVINANKAHFIGCNWNEPTISVCPIRE